MNLAFWTNSIRSPDDIRERVLPDDRSEYPLGRAIAGLLGRSMRSVLGNGSNAARAQLGQRWQDYARALLILCLCTALASSLSGYLGLINIVMLYLLGTTVSALRLGRGPSIMICVLNVIAVDYFFVPPLFSLNVQDPRSLFTLAVMLLVALVITSLMARIRTHRDMCSARERRTAVLYAMSRELAVASDSHTMVRAAVHHICAVFNSTAVVLLADAAGTLTPVDALPDGVHALPADFDPEFAAAVCKRGERCVNDLIYLPLQGKRRVKGVVIVCPRERGVMLPAEQLNLLDAFAAQLALSLQRARLAEAAEASKVASERILLRNTLLASISHDLRTPLSAIAGAGSLLAQPEYALNDDRRSTLGHLIERKALDMTQLLTNVLELVQMEFGSGALRAEWHSMDDLVGVALRNNQARLAQWRISVAIPDDLQPIRVEATLILKILNNLLENAAKYTPAGTSVTIVATADAKNLLLVVEDDGPGLPAGDHDTLFDKFQRGHSESNIVGVGLGLAICRAAARLHGGDIRAMDRAGGGARFEITLPVETRMEASEIELV